MNYRDIFTKNGVVVKKVTLKNNVKIIDTSNGCFVIKKRSNNKLDDTFNYLRTRAFDNFANKVYEFDDYDMYEYIDDGVEPFEQRAIDLIYLLSLLHSKTTFYKEIDYDYYKEIYENINTEIEYLYNYYNDILNIISSNVYMSPSSYLIARNINKVFDTLDYCKKNNDIWYDKINDKKKMRVVNIHNNVCLDHFIKKDKAYLISWDKNKIDMPIYDLLCFYKNHYLELDFVELFTLYESRYPLLDEEKVLLFVLIALPSRIDFIEDEYNMCIKCSHFFDYLYKSERLISALVKH